MHVPMPALLVSLVVSLSLCAEEPASPQRQPIPEEKLLKDAEALVRDFFKTDYSKSGPAERGALAKKLLHEAGQTNTDMDLKYVLLCEARNMALDGGHVKVALSALDALGVAFEYDAIKGKTELLSQLARSVKTPEASQNLAETCLLIAEEMLAKDQYDQARILVGQAETAAKVVRDEEWLKGIQRRAKNARDLLREYDRIAVSFKKLEEQPDDPEANTAVGRFFCFIKGDWDRGLGLLAKGSESRLKSMAQAELAGPADADAQAKLGNEWWQYGKTVPGAARFVVQEHAVNRLLKALPELEAEKREAVTQTIVAFYTAAMERGQTGAAFEVGNVALLTNGTTLSRLSKGGVLSPEARTAMLDGITTGYTGSTGFTSGTFPCTWVVNLPKVYLLQEIRVLLYDNDERIFRYVLETSMDGTTYELVKDCSKGGWRSWQTLRFPPRLVRYIRFKGLYDSANSGFYIVELEAYCLPPAEPAKPRFPSTPGEDSDTHKKHH